MRCDAAPFQGRIQTQAGPVDSVTALRPPPPWMRGQRTPARVWRIVHSLAPRVKARASACRQIRHTSGSQGDLPIIATAMAVLSLTQAHLAYGHVALLDGASLSLEAGERLGLIGRNGAGKTTLMKLLLGMYQPSEGRIRYGALSTEERSLPLLREQIGVVSQDDQLILGTVEQNISVFDVDVDMEQVVRCATLAGVHEEILRLPLGYRTRVGGLGSPFSEGQKQKIFLARALYRNPRVLLMDEGTANIAPAAEEQILSNLQALGMTMLLIAHRSATVRRADRVLTLRNGRIEEPLQRSVAG